MPEPSKIKRTAGLLTVRFSWLLPVLWLSGAPLALAQARVDVLEESMLGEFALQAGDIPGASHHYGRAARASTRIELIDRAATVSLYAKDYVTAEAVGDHWLATEPDSVGARRALAWAALATRDPEGALPWLKALLEAASIEGQRAVAQVLVAAENRADAPAVLLQLLDLGLLTTLDNGPNWSAIASNLKALDAAAQLAEADARAHPKDPEVWRRSAQVHLARDDAAAAERALAKAVDLAPADFDLRLALATLMSQSGRVDAADRVLADAPVQDDRSYAARIANAAIKPDSKILKRIQKALERSRSGVQTRAFLLGQVAELRDQPDQALQWYAQEPAGAAWNDAQLRRAVLLARHHKDLPGARQLLAEMRAQGQDEEASVDAWLLEAELTQPSDPAAGAQIYGDALQQYPNDIRLLYARAMYRIGLDDVAGLEADLRAILAVDPDNPQALNALGYTLTDRTERHAEALGYIEKALKAQPDDPAFIDSMGWVQYRLGKHDEALVHLRRAYQLAPDGEVAAHLGEVLWVAGHHEEARVHWRDALKRWPENRPLIESVRRLQPDLLP